MPFKAYAPDPYHKIVRMVKAYHSTFRLISSTLNSMPSPPVRLDIQNEPIGYVISPGELQKIIDNISHLDGFANYLFMFGIDPDYDNLTFCVVGANANGDVLPVYKDNPSTYGEEKWPTVCKAKLSDSSLDSFLD